MLIVLRGIPGAGKTYLANQRFPTATRISADDYMVDADGAYKFEGKRLPEVHGKCFRRVINLLQRRVGEAEEPLILIDNTAIKAVDAAPYIAAAGAYGVRACVITLLIDPAIAAARNAHGVPPEKVFTLGGEILRELLPSRWERYVLQWSSSETAYRGTLPQIPGP